MCPEEFKPIKAALKKNHLFEGFSEQELNEIAVLAKIKTFAPEKFLIYEEKENPQEFYIIQSGDVEIVKSLQNNGDFYQITALTEGDVVGEIALLGNVKRTASARALTETIVIALPVIPMRELSQSPPMQETLKKRADGFREKPAELRIFDKITRNMASGLSGRLSDTNVTTATALKKELRLTKMRVFMGRFLVLIITIMALYAFSLSAMDILLKHAPSTTIIAFPMMVLFTLPILYVVLTSGYPLSLYGLTLKNWHWSTLNAILWSLPVLAIIVLFKWVMIQWFELPYPLFEGVRSGFSDNAGLLLILLSLLGYILLAPLQEFLARGAIQSSLQHFLTGNHKNLTAIFVSNLIFSMAHLHLSLGLGVSVFFSGLFWGFMYARQKNLVGVSISHVLIGVWALYCVGIQKTLLVIN